MFGSAGFCANFDRKFRRQSDGLRIIYNVLRKLKWPIDTLAILQIHWQNRRCI